MKRTLFGAVCGLAICGTAAAQPPGARLSEGRELDPVAREQYRAPQGAAPAPAARPTERPGDMFSTALALVEALVRDFTIPLGTAPR
jgi:hypothetical protein